MPALYSSIPPRPITSRMWSTFRWKWLKATRPFRNLDAGNRCLVLAVPLAIVITAMDYTKPVFVSW